MHSRKFKLIFRIVLIVVILVILGVIITVGAMNAKAITRQYNELSNKPVNSARQFKIPFGYITVSADGTIDIEFADSIRYSAVNTDIDEAEFEGANPEDDRQNAGPDVTLGDAGSAVGETDNDRIFPETVAEIKEKLEASGDARIVNKADVLANVYISLRSSLSDAGIIGIMASIVEEGTPGEVQWSHSIENWNGDGVTLESTANDPLIIGSNQNLTSVIAHCNKSSNTTGVGICQFTYYTHFNEENLPSYYKEYCGEDSFTYGNLLKAEIEYTRHCANGLKGYPPSDDVRDCAYRWVKDFERPADADAAAASRMNVADEIKKLLS